MEKLRIGIIGVGNMGSAHARNFMAGLIPEAELTAICDIEPIRRDWARENLPSTVEIYDNTDDFFANAPVDAVVVATPHYLHPVLVQEAFRHGKHALSEKPAGVYTKAVREMNAAAEEAAKKGLVFGIMFNQRTNPVYAKARELVQAGELGQLKRAVWIITNWYRGQGYYNSGGWRATWSGEGGGVLLNQDPHQLDLWQWICGMPTKVHAFMQFGKGRDIEVENDVTAYVEYENGATGLFVTSTHECPGTNRLEISGDRGRIIIENDKLIFDRLEVSEPEYSRMTAEKKMTWGTPGCWHCEIPCPPAPNGHVEVMNNWISAILHGTPLLAPGVEGIRGLTISNAMHLSAWTGKTVETANMDEDLYYELLQQHIRESTFVKKNVSLNKDAGI